MALREGITYMSLIGRMIKMCSEKEVDRDGIEREDDGDGIKREDKRNCVVWGDYIYGIEREDKRDG